MTRSLYGVGRNDSPARRVLSARQKALGGALFVLIVAGLVVRMSTTLTALISAGTAVYLAVFVFKLVAVRDAVLLRSRAPRQVPKLPDEDLPRYSVLVPLYKEGAVVVPLVTHLSRLDYPTDKLEILLLCEQDDTETLNVFHGVSLPPQFRLVVCPPGEPRTKPRACNIGLAVATGDLCVIYDAEDRPELDQLRIAAETFAVSEPDIACLQGRLDYHNHDHNWLTQFFTVEYNFWFDLLLPALAERDLPIPLGGTSNHFRTEVLASLGGWDPFNVTEDADLGVRLFAGGYRTKMLESVTWEEACSKLGAWTRQRTRWLKGYLQTWAVHTRGGSLRRRGGVRGVAGLHMLIGGTPVVSAINPFFWGMFVVFAATRAHAIEALFPRPLQYISVVSLVLGNFLFMYLNLIAVVHRRRWHLGRAVLFTPVYWLLMSVACWRAIWHLVWRPHQWEKTPHGLSGQDTDPATMSAATAEVPLQATAPTPAIGVDTP